MITAFSGWEFGKICVDCDCRVNDLTLDEAKKLLVELQKAIESFENMEKEAQDYFKNE